MLAEWHGLRTTQTQRPMDSCDGIRSMRVAAVVGRERVGPSRTFLCGMLLVPPCGALGLAAWGASVTIALVCSCRCMAGRLVASYGPCSLAHRRRPREDAARKGYRNLGKRRLDEVAPRHLNATTGIETPWHDSATNRERLDAESFNFVARVPSCSCEGQPHQAG